MANNFDNIKEKIQKNIKSYRQQKGLTQVQLSINSGATEDYIYRIEKGKRTPIIERLFNIASALNVDIIDLLK